MGDGNKVKGGSCIKTWSKTRHLASGCDNVFLGLWGGRNMKQRGAPDDNMDLMQVGDGFVSCSWIAAGNVQSKFAEDMNKGKGSG